MSKLTVGGKPFPFRSKSFRRTKCETCNYNKARAWLDANFTSALGKWVDDKGKRVAFMDNDKTGYNADWIHVFAIEEE